MAVGVTWPFWIMWHQLEYDSWDVQASVPVQFRPPLVYSDGLLDSPPDIPAVIIPDEGREILPKIRELFPHNFDSCVQNVSSEIMFPESKNIHSQRYT